ncbi:MAG: response regulator [Deltaproteobacteria bacterium]|nr:response regulator [Deltaproteobacteria bacterium]
MTSNSLLKDRVILAVDDEKDILDTVAMSLDRCILHKADDFDTASQFLQSYTYDIVILDIMGVNGFELLKVSVRHGFPTVMLTAHDLNPEALKKSIRLGAVSFLPKEKIADLETFLEDVVLGGGRPVWKKLFDRIGDFFNRRFGQGWDEKDRFFREFQQEMLRDSDPGTK